MNDRLTERVIGCRFEVHRELGPGFPEGIYHRAIEKALTRAKIAYASGKAFRVSYQGAAVGTFKLDLLVEECVVVEIKAVSGVMPRVFEAQVIAYLKAARLPVGLLVNFGNSSCHVRRLEHSR